MQKEGREGKLRQHVRNASQPIEKEGISYGHWGVMGVSAGAGYDLSGPGRASNQLDQLKRMFSTFPQATS